MAKTPATPWTHEMMTKIINDWDKHPTIGSLARELGVNPLRLKKVAEDFNKRYSNEGKQVCPPKASIRGTKKLIDEVAASLGLKPIE